MIEQATARHPAISFRVGDMFALPYADASLAGVIGFYAIVHMPTDELHAPCRELHRVVTPGGLLALAFHAGTEHTHVDELWGIPTALEFWFHPAEAVAAILEDVGFTIEARLDRRPYPDVEYPSHRTYLLARRRGP